MTPTVPQLLEWRPDQLDCAGDLLMVRAAALDQAADELDAVRTGLRAAWSGSAADAAAGHTVRRQREVEQLAGTVRTAGRTLTRAADTLGAAQAALRDALDTAAVTGCRVLPSGTVEAPAVLAGAPLAGLPGQQDVADRLSQQVQSALHAAGDADAQAAAALAQLAVPQISPAPGQAGAAAAGPPPGPGVGGRPWWSRAGSLPGDVASDLLDGVTDVGDAVLDTAGYALTHPQESLPLLADTAEIALGAFGMAVGAAGEVGGTALDATGVGAVAGVPINVASAALIVGSAGLAAHGARGMSQDLSTMHMRAHPRKPMTGEREGDTAPGFAGLEQSREEIAQAAYLHSGAPDNPRRPNFSEIMAALRGPGRQIEGRTAFEYRYGDVKVYVNGDMPWRSTAVKKGAMPVE